MLSCGSANLPKDNVSVASDDDLSVDPVTGLPVVNVLLPRVAEKLNQGKQVGFLYFDIVEFHHIIDTCGEEMASTLLQRIGSVLTMKSGKLFRSDDIVAVGYPRTDYFVLFLLSPPRCKQHFTDGDLKRISFRIQQSLSNVAHDFADAHNLDQKIDFHTGYATLQPEVGVSIDRLFYEVQKEAYLKGALDEMMVTFISNVTHELRTPLTCIKGFAETLLAGAVEDKELSIKWLEIIKSESERLERLINDLLDISMVEAKQSVFNMEYCSIENLLQHTINVLSVKAEQANITIKANIAAKLPQVFLDSDRISQVIVNIIDNAVKYSPAHTTVDVSAVLAEGNCVDISVADHGSGIPPGQLNRIFERFYRVGKGRTARRHAGRGLGLAIAKRLVEAHGGDIFVSSEVDKGSIFTIRLPVHGPTQEFDFADGDGSIVGDDED